MFLTPVGASQVTRSRIPVPCIARIEVDSFEVCVHHSYSNKPSHKKTAKYHYLEINCQCVVTVYLYVSRISLANKYSSCRKNYICRRTLFQMNPCRCRIYHTKWIVYRFDYLYMKRCFDLKGLVQYCMCWHNNLVLFRYKYVLYNEQC